MHNTCKLQTQNTGIINEHDIMHIKYVLTVSIRLEAFLDIFLYLFDLQSQNLFDMTMSMHLCLFPAIIINLNSHHTIQDMAYSTWNCELNTNFQGMRLKNPNTYALLLVPDNVRVNYFFEKIDYMNGLTALQIAYYLSLVFLEKKIKMIFLKLYLKNHYNYHFSVYSFDYIFYDVSKNSN